MEANIIWHEIRSFLYRTWHSISLRHQVIKINVETNEISKKKTKKKNSKARNKNKNPWTILVWKASLVQLKRTPSLICIPIWQILISLVSYRCISILIAYHRPDKSTWQLQLCSTEHKKLLSLPPEIIVIMYYNWQIVSFLLFSFRNMWSKIVKHQMIPFMVRKKL